MVSPAKPHSTGQTTAKTPKEPKAAPSEETLIPPDLARQNIPSPAPQKKLEESSITPKEDLTPQDVNVTKKAQEVLGIEDSSDTDSDSLDFFDSLMEEETSPSEAVHQPEETPSEPIEDGLDFFDDLMGDSNMPEDSPSSPVEQKLHTAKDAVENLIAGIDKEVKKDVENSVISLQLIASNQIKGIPPKELRPELEELLDDLEQLVFNSNIKLESLSDLKNINIIFHKKLNTIATGLDDSEHSRKLINEFINELKLDKEQIKSLRVIQLKKDEWNQVVSRLEIKILERQNTRAQKNDLTETEEIASKSGDRKPQEVTRSNNNSYSQNKSRDLPERRVDLTEELTSEWIHEETLRNERDKLRTKRAAEKEHRAVDKETQDWERQHAEIKKDADARSIKRHTP